MYSRVSNHLENGVFYVAESEQNKRLEDDLIERSGNATNLLIVLYVQIMSDDFVMQLHRF